MLYYKYIKVGSKKGGKAMSMYIYYNKALREIPWQTR